VSRSVLFRDAVEADIDLQIPQTVIQGLCATMNDVPDDTDQRELLKRFIEEGRPATLEAIAGFVEGSGGSYYSRKTCRDQMRESALVRVELGSDSGLPASLEQIMRAVGRVQQPGQP
jgi:hypothetical protein